MNFSLSLYNKTWDSPTLINLTNLTRGVRYCQVPNPFLVSGSGAEKAPIMNYCSFGGCVFLFFNMLSPGGGDGAGGSGFRPNIRLPSPETGESRRRSVRRGAVKENGPFLGNINYFFVFLHQLENNELKCRSFMTR